MKRSTRILISGGGVAGLTLAYWLNHYGFEPVVIEKTAGPRQGGYGIDFFGTGYDVATRIGIIEQLTPLQIPVEYIAYVNKTGETIAKLAIDTMRKALNGRYIGLMHDALESVLYEAVKDKVEIRFGTTITAVEQTATGVRVVFPNGEEEPFDLLIGADGIHSNVRRLVFGQEAQFARYLGYYFAFHSLPDRYDVGSAWKNYVEPQRTAAAYRTGCNDELNIFFIWEADDVGPIPPAQRLTCLQEKFAGSAWITPQALADIQQPEAIFMDSVTQIVMPRWSSGRVTLVGDASGCVTFLSGQGASMAMGGAYLLAEELAQSASYEDAFDNFERRMRPSIEKRQQQARNFSKVFVPGSQWKLALQLLLMKIILRPSFAFLLRQQFQGESILNKHNIPG